MSRELKIHNIPEKNMSDERSQVQAINERPAETWDELESQTLSTFHGGHDGGDLSNFQHGMRTVFELLRKEFPEMMRCKHADTYCEQNCELQAFRDGVEQAYRDGLETMTSISRFPCPNQERVKDET
jgi:hypothetical protein